MGKALREKVHCRKGHGLCSLSKRDEKSRGKRAGTRHLRQGDLAKVRAYIAERGGNAFNSQSVRESVNGGGGGVGGGGGGGWGGPTCNGGELHCFKGGKL